MQKILAEFKDCYILEDVLVEVTINEALETISINGEFDLLIEEEFGLDDGFEDSYERGEE